MSDLGTPALLAIFVGAALATWVAGVNLAKATDLLDDRYGLGEALGGMMTQFLATFREFPPRQKAASFTIDQAVAKLETALTTGR